MAVHAFIVLSRWACIFLYTIYLQSHFVRPPGGGEWNGQLAENPRQGAHSRGLPPIARGVGVVVRGVCLLVVLIGRLGRHGAGLVGMLNEVPAVAEHEFDPPAVQCKFQTPPDLLEEDELAHSMADVEEPEMPIGELRGDQVDNDVEFAGQLRARAGDEAQDVPEL